MNQQPVHSIDATTATIIAVVSAAVTLPFGESVIGVQLDAIGAEFNASTSTMRWVVNAYMLTFATSILASGLLADRLGRRRLFTLGLVLGMAGNGLAIIAPSSGALVLLRALAGLGAGVLLASGPALLSARFSAPNAARSRAFAAFGAAAGSGIALGPPVGGLIMSLSGWRMVFAIYLPFLLLALCLVPHLEESRNPDGKRIDYPGLLLFSLSLAALIVVMAGGLQTMVRNLLLTAAATCAALFVMSERRQANPAIDTGFFAIPIFQAMCLVLCCWQITVAVSMVYVPAVAVAGLGVSVKLAGASILPMALALFLTVPLGPWLVSRTGIRGFAMLCGSLLLAGELLIWLALEGFLPVTATLAIGLLIMGIGGGAFNGCVDNLALSVVSSQRAGAASGVFQTVRISAAAVAVAAAGSLLELGTASDPASGLVADPAMVRGYANFAGLGVLCMLALLGLSWLVLRARKHQPAS